MRKAKERRASRLILLDEEGRILLFRHKQKNGSSFWAPPGGGLEPGESFEEAALREAEEELGLKGFPVKLLWEGWSDFVHVGTPVRQHQRFFLLKAKVPTISAEVQKMHEDEGIIEMRWWTISALATTTELVFPDQLVPELKKISD